MPRMMRKKMYKAKPKSRAAGAASAAKPRSRFVAGRRRRLPLVRRYRTAAGAITNSLWAFGRGARLPRQVQALRRVGAPDIYQDNFAETVSTQVGLQTFKSYGSLLRAQLTSLASIAGNQSAPNRILLESAQTEITFTNITNAAVEVELYDIVFKRDVPATTTVALAAGSYIFNSTPENMITEGTKAASGVPPSSLTDPSTYIGASPFDSQFFKDYCMVKQKSHVMLASGATHRHQTLAKINRVAEQAIVGNQNLNYVKGFSYCTLLCVRGAAAAILESDDSTTNQATLNVVTSLRMKYTWCSDVNYSAYYHNNLSTDAVTQVRNIGNGAIESVTPA